MFWIQNRSDRHHFRRSGSGSVSISTECKGKLNFFSGKSYKVPYRYYPKHWKFCHLWRADSKDETILTGTAVNKMHKSKRIYNMCQTWDQNRIRVWIGIKTESRIRIGIKTLPIHNTDRMHKLLTSGKRAKHNHPPPPSPTWTLSVLWTGLLKIGTGTYQYCRSGSEIRCLFNPWIRDGEN